MLLKEVRKDDNKLLFKILVEKESLIISIKGRGCKEPILYDLKDILGPYITNDIRHNLKTIFRIIYEKKLEEKKIHNN